VPIRRLAEDRFCDGSKLPQLSFLWLTAQEMNMSVEGKIKEGAGFVKEELNEHGKDAESKKKAQ
jgi:hypothetical protein